MGSTGILSKNIVAPAPFLPGTTHSRASGVLSARRGTKNWAWWPHMKARWSPGALGRRRSSPPVLRGEAGEGEGQGAAAPGDNQANNTGREGEEQGAAPGENQAHNTGRARAGQGAAAPGDNQANNTYYEERYAKFRDDPEALQGFLLACTRAGDWRGADFVLHRLRVLQGSCAVAQSVEWMIECHCPSYRGSAYELPGC